MRTALLAVLALLAADGPAFDVSSVKPFLDDGKSPRAQRTWAPDGITCSGCSLAFIIAEAFGAPPGTVIGPGSLTKENLWPALSQGYTVIGKAGHPATKDQLRAMLRTLLAERFQLVTHREAKTQSAYKMTVAPGGLKIEESQDPGGAFAFQRTAEGYAFRNAEVMRLTSFLSGRVDRAVVDETGLIVPAATDKSTTGNSADPPSAALLRDALKQLGFQLTAGQAQVEYLVLVIDRVEKPSDN